LWLWLLLLGDVLEVRGRRATKRGEDKRGIKSF